MSKKLGFSLSGLMLAMVAGTASADMDGGQLNISGLVVDNTCETRVDGGNKDGLILPQPLVKSMQACSKLPLVPRLNLSASPLIAAKQTLHRAALPK